MTKAKEKTLVIQIIYCTYHWTYENINIRLSDYKTVLLHYKISFLHIVIHLKFLAVLNIL